MTMTGAWTLRVPSASVTTCPPSTPIRFAVASER
jgi:hypothetical protein